MKKRIKLTEAQLHNVIRKCINEALNGEAEGNATYEDYKQFLGGQTPVFEFGDNIVYVDYDEATGNLVSGGATNAGFYPDGEAEIPVEDGDFQSAMEEMYAQLSEKYGDFE